MNNRGENTRRLTNSKEIFWEWVLRIQQRKASNWVLYDHNSKQSTELYNWPSFQSKAQIHFHINIQWLFLLMLNKSKALACLCLIFQWRKIMFLSFNIFQCGKVRISNGISFISWRFYNTIVLKHKIDTNICTFTIRDECANNLLQMMNWLSSLWDVS